MNGLKALISTPLAIANAAAQADAAASEAAQSVLVQTDHVSGVMPIIAPAAALVILGSLIMGGAAFTPAGPATVARRSFWGGLALLSILVAALLCIWRAPPDTLSGALFQLDATAVAGERLTLLGGALLVLIGWVAAPGRHYAEYYGGLVLLLGGLMLASISADLVGLFVALELVSIPTYVMLALARGDGFSWEATLKYFTLSAFASAFFVFGASLLYGIAGSTELALIQEALAEKTSNPLAMIGLLMVIGGLCFRVTAVPFHFYAADVFAGTSLPMAAVLSFLPKVAGFVAMIRLLGGDTLNAPIGQSIELPLIVIAIATMCFGNALALIQGELRRLLAYSSIAHSGYLLLGLVALATKGSPPTALLQYLAAYAAMTLGFFAAMASLEVSGLPAQRLVDLTGLIHRRPAIAAVFIFSLLSLIGLPLTAGFWAKLQIFFASIATQRTDMIVAAIVMAFNAAIAAAYYVRCMLKLFERPFEGAPQRTWNPAVAAAALACTVLTVLWFFTPKWL
jgi:NADH-quinone oxidoreductase subunit N